MLKPFFSVVGCLGVCGELMAEVKHRVEVKELKVTIQQTPQFQVAGPREKRIEPKFWAELEAELEVESTKERGDVPFITDLQANWYVVIEDKVNTSAKDKPVMLSGKSVYKLVPTEPGKVLVSAYIEPDVLLRYTGKKRPTEADLKSMAVVISGANIVSEGKYAEKLMKAEGVGDNRKWWVDWKFDTQSDFVVPKSKTPFAPLWADLYPSEKIE